MYLINKKLIMNFIVLGVLVIVVGLVIGLVLIGLGIG